jgi:hypothetical protein
MKAAPLRTVLAVIAVLVPSLAPVARAHVELRATLDGAQEVPAVSTTATATASFTFADETKTLEYAITIVQPLTGGAIIGAHIHEGLPGQANPVPRVPLDTDLQGTADLSSDKCAAKGGTSQGAGSSCFAGSPCSP